MDYLDKALVLDVKDYKDNDRLCRALTLEHGKVTVKMTGVKKPKAKLKFAAQPFAFYTARFITGKGGFLTATDVVGEESFYEISSDMKMFAAASVCMQATDISVSAGEDCSSTFIEALKFLRSTLYDGDPYYSACVYMLYLLKDGGFYKKYDGNENPISVNDLLSIAQKRGYIKSDYGDLSRRALKHLAAEFCVYADIPSLPAIKSVDIY